jgi:hypothetical protein
MTYSDLLVRTLQAESRAAARLYFDPFRRAFVFLRHKAVLLFGSLDVVSAMLAVLRREKLPFLVRHVPSLVVSKDDTVFRDFRRNRSYMHVELVSYMFVVDAFAALLTGASESTLKRAQPSMIRALLAGRELLLTEYSLKTLARVSHILINLAHSNDWEESAIRCQVLLMNLAHAIQAELGVKPSDEFLISSHSAQRYRRLLERLETSAATKRLLTDGGGE